MRCCSIHKRSEAEFVAWRPNEVFRDIADSFCRQCAMMLMDQKIGWIITSIDQSDEPYTAIGIRRLREEDQLITWTNFEGYVAIVPIRYDYTIETNYARSRFEMKQQGLLS